MEGRVSYPCTVRGYSNNIDDNYFINGIVFLRF